MDELIVVASRIHDEDIPGTVIIDDCDYQHLNLPYGAGDESTIDWFQKTWATRLNTEGEAVFITSRIHKEEEGQKE